VVALGVVETVLARGETKTSIVTKRGVQVDVRVVAEHQLGAALLYFTGSKAHNVKLRQRALKRGWTLNEYALSELDGGRVIASETEEQIYRALGLPFIEPELREDWGELEAGDAGQLPARYSAISGDFHVHTSVSGDGRASLEQMVDAAKARGYAVLALTDHAEGTLSGVSRETLLEQREQIRALQQQLGDSLQLLHGVELNIGPEGELDYDAELRQSFDWCVASVHSHFELDREAQTRRLIAAIQDPSVRMLGHLTARMIGGRPPIELDLPQVFAAARARGVALEVNGALPRLDPAASVLQAAVAEGLELVLTSDAHDTSELELVDYAARHAFKARVPGTSVINSWAPARLREFVARR
jgi:DNA polymerase (family 10)